MPLLSAWGCMVVGLLLIKALGIRSGVIVLAVTVAGAIGGGYVGKKMNNFVKSAATAFVGAFLTLRGIGMFLPKAYAYPSEFDDTSFDDNDAKQAAVWLYLVGLLFLFFSGTFGQLYLFRDEAADKDDLFEREEEGRRWWCF